MQLGMIGLGRMGANLVRRLMRAGHQCVVYDPNAEAVQTSSSGLRKPLRQRADRPTPGLRGDAPRCRTSCGPMASRGPGAAGPAFRE